MLVDLVVVEGDAFFEFLCQDLLEGNEGFGGF